MRPEDLFAALADQTRYGIVTLLKGRRRGFSVGEIADRLGSSEPSVSQHLKLLRSTGLVESRREGQRVICTLAPLARRRLTEAFRGLREDPGGPFLSARNRLLGTVVAVDRDRVTSGVTLDVAGQRIRAIITTEALDELGLEPGDAAYAVVKATEVMLMR